MQYTLILRQALVGVSNLITLFDGILIGLMLVSGVLAMIRGFSREVLSVGSWLAAAAAAFYFYKPLSPIVKPYITFTSSPVVPDVVAAAIVFIITLIIVSLITMRIADFIVDSKVGALDRTLGFVFGALRGMLLVTIGLLFFNWLVPDNDQPDWVAKSKSKPMLNSFGESIIEILPEDGGKSIIDRVKSDNADSTATDTTTN